jgi:hypothetical protein
MQCINPIFSQPLFDAVQYSLELAPFVSLPDFELC